MAEKFNSFAKGQELASKAEVGSKESMDAVNNELAQLRSQHPRQFNDIITAMQGTNKAHLAEDQQRVQRAQKSKSEQSIVGSIIDFVKGAEEPKLKVRELRFADSPNDADKDPDHLEGYVLPSLKITDNKPLQQSNPPVETAPVLKDGDYPNTALGREKAWNDFTNPRGKK